MPARIARSHPLATVLTVAALIAPRPASAQKTGPLTPERAVSLAFREIGPAVTGGRIHDVEAVPGHSQIVYVGAASGGVWKSVNGGTTWTPLWDELPNASVGDIALAPSDPDILYVGTGGPNNRQSTLYGNGVWRSADGGMTWTHLGLVETRHIGRIRVHPRDPDIAFVAALGNLWKSDPERGVFKTTDGGRSWHKVLFVDEHTGVVDLVMDPTNPDVLYAAAYQRQRRTYGFIGGGPGSGIYKTTDGGGSWKELTNGIPEEDKGRIGLAISATDPRVLNATIEHASAGGTYRTEDGGGTWEFMSRTNPRPMYYSHIYIDPTDANRVYVLGTSSSVSEDGGQSFRSLPTTPSYDFGVHADHHTLWIDPGDPSHIYLAGDAGLHVSWDRGITWKRINNFSIGQFYGIGADMRDPYRVYGGMQDNHSWMGPSKTRRVIGIVNDDWSQIGFGDGMYTRPDPVDPRWVFLDSNGGGITRFDSETGASQGIRPREPEGEPRYRFDWTAPILISPHDHRRIYLGGNRLFISDDHGDSWRRTVDLSRQIDRDTLPIMGMLPVRGTLSRHDGTSSFGEMTVLDESVLEVGLLWVGMDDGNLQVSEDGGESWREVSGNVRGLPDGTYVSRVRASQFVRDRVYATFDAHRDGDFRPFVFASEDLGGTWRSLSRGLPEEGSVNVILEHPGSPDVLFVGTEQGLFMSMDRGGAWMPLKNNLPRAPIDDLLIHPREKDLIVGTHGRSIWILEDVGPLADLAAPSSGESIQLFDVRPATQWQRWKATSYRGQGEWSAPQPPGGAVITYWLGSEESGGVFFEVSDDTGRVVSRIDGSSEAGLQRVVWDLRMDPPQTGRRGGPGGGRGGRGYPGMTPYLEEVLASSGPFVLPGTYTVRAAAGGVVRSTTVLVRPDPADPYTAAERRTRWVFLVDAWDLAEHASGEGEALSSLTASARTAGEAARSSRAAPAGLAAEIDSIIVQAEELAQEWSRSMATRAGRLFSGFGTGASDQGTLGGPTSYQREDLALLKQHFADLSRRTADLRENRVGAVNRRLQEAALPTISARGRTP